jgi:hypothetical protein
MKVSETIPMTPQSWNKNPEGYVRHQTKLKQLVEWFEANGIDVSLPKDTGSWDKGVDLIASGTRIDLKSFGVEPYGISYTWSSRYYKGRPAPIYSETETDYFIHPMGDNPEKWIVAPASELRTSKYNLPPYYFQSVCMTVGKLAQRLCTKHTV